MNMTPKNLIELLQKRYTCKAFDPSKKIDSEHIHALVEALRLTPSSVNGQPWHFFITQTLDGKKKIAQATQGVLSFNTPKIMDCSHVVVIAAKNKLDEQYLDVLVEQEHSDKRYTHIEAQQIGLQTKKGYTKLHEQNGNTANWTKQQCYLSLSTLLLSAALLGIDSCPIEGFDAPTLDEVLDLKKQGLHSAVLVALGYRGEQDFNFHLPKSRLPHHKVVTFI